MPAGGDDDVDWSDWDAAHFVPLHEEHPVLDGELRTLFAETLIRSAQLSPNRVTQAAREVEFERGQTPKGVVILRAHLPLGAGHPEHEWDGSSDEARKSAVSMAETAGETIVVERADGWPTGWETDLEAAE